MGPEKKNIQKYFRGSAVIKGYKIIELVLIVWKKERWILLNIPGVKLKDCPISSNQTSSFQFYYLIWEIVHFHGTTSGAD